VCETGCAIWARAQWAHEHSKAQRMEAISSAQRMEAISSAQLQMVSFWGWSAQLDSLQVLNDNSWLNDEVSKQSQFTISDPVLIYGFGKIVNVFVHRAIQNTHGECKAFSTFFYTKLTGVQNDIFCFDDIRKWLLKVSLSLPEIFLFFFTSAFNTSPLPPTSYPQPTTSYFLPPTYYLQPYLLPPTYYLLLPTSYLLPPTLLPTSYFLPPTSYLLLPTSYFLPPTYYLLLPTSYLLPPTPPPTSYLLPTTSYFLPPTYYLLLPTSYLLPPTLPPTSYLLPPTPNPTSYILPAASSLSASRLLIAAPR
jgi:hypothetical protein